jgi:hypothetical protein
VTALVEALRGIDRDLVAILGADPHAPGLIAYRAQMREASEAEQRAAQRRFERLMLGCCPCGETAGEAECPWCDGGLPPGMRDAGIALRQRQRAQGVIDAFHKTLAEARIEKAKIAADMMADAPRPPNRKERRRARSRRWRG